MGPGWGPSDRISYAISGPRFAPKTLELPTIPPSSPRSLYHESPMNNELVLKFVDGANRRRFLSLKMLFDSVKKTQFQVALIIFAVVCRCAFADTSEAQTVSPEKGPVSVGQPADGPDIEILTSRVQESAVQTSDEAAALKKTAPAALLPKREDLRFDQLPGYQRYKEIRDNARKLQEGGRVYKIR